ncbi:MAG: Scr1 family TA system antitoxin-like transcriptional regulator, partial [Sciscionella sp.]
MGTPLRTAKKLLLGHEIEHMITTVHSNQTEAAKHIETSQSRIAALIDGTGRITVGDLERLATKLGFTDQAYLDALLELRRDNHKRGFWTTGHNRAYAEALRLLVDLEKHADLLRTAEVEIMPGLVQCEAYIHALHEHDETTTTDTRDHQTDPNTVTVTDKVQARLARQQVLLTNNPPEFRAVLSESCLRREYGGRKVMLEQINHLITLSQKPNIQIQIMPFTLTPRRTGMANRFVLLRVPSPGAAGPLEMAYVENEEDIRYLDDKTAFAARDTVWSRLSAAALNTDDSRTFMEHITRTFRRT